jgi:hypothetical protein
MLPYYIIFKGKQMWDTWCQGGPPGCFYNVSESGWMETPLFTEWFKSVFLPNVAHINGPKLLLMDGHASHISCEVVDLARTNEVHMFCFPSNSSHLTQPIDVAILKPAKTVFRGEVEKHGLATNFMEICKQTFNGIFSKVVDSGKAFLRRHVVAGFEATGKLFKID